VRDNDEKKNETSILQALPMVYSFSEPSIACQCLRSNNPSNSPIIERRQMNAKKVDYQGEKRGKVAFVKPATSYVKEEYVKDC
jgi:hypothetical protein